MAEYPKYKLPFEALTTIDERVDFIHNQMVQIQLALNELLGREGLPTMAEITRQVTLRAVLPPMQGSRIANVSPITGKIVQIVPHWPAGCAALVGIAFGHSDTWVMPDKTDTFIALDDTTPVLQASESVTKGEELWMIARNGDAINTHTVSVTAVIIGVMGE